MWSNRLTLLSYVRDLSEHTDTSDWKEQTYEGQVEGETIGRTRSNTSLVWLFTDSGPFNTRTKLPGFYLYSHPSLLLFNPQQGHQSPLNPNGDIPFLFNFLFLLTSLLPLSFLSPTLFLPWIRQRQHQQQGLPAVIHPSQPAPDYG